MTPNVVTETKCQQTTQRNFMTCNANNQGNKVEKNQQTSFKWSVKLALPVCHLQPLYHMLPETTWLYSLISNETPWFGLSFDKPINSQNKILSALTLKVLVTTHDNWCTETLWNRIMTAQCEGMGEVGLAGYEPALLPPCPSIRVQATATVKDPATPCLNECSEI